MNKIIKTINLRALLILIILHISCNNDIEVTPDTTPPTIDFIIKGITQNDNEEPPIVGNIIEIEIDAKDAKGVSKVEAFLDNTKVGEDTNAPFKISVDLNQYAKKLNKGIRLNKTQTKYILKVTATDLSDNTSSIEKEIIVDNEKPTITEVTLETNTVIKGNDNLFTFKANDDKEIISLKVKVNDTEIETTAIDSITYAINIDSSILEDGQNSLNITASDQATNTATHNTLFLVDNTGPEINIDGPSIQNNIIDEVTLFSITTNDVYSNVDSLKVFVNDSLIIKSENNNLNLDFNPDNYETGNTTIKVTAIDKLGNQSVQELNFIIKRLLLKINVPNNFVNPSISEFYVFTSKKTGELLALKSLKNNTSSQIKINTLTDILPDEEYSLNFAYLYRGVGETSIIKTIQNIKRSSLDKIDLKVPESRNVSSQNTYQTSEMPIGTSIIGEGSDYSSSYDPENGFYIEDYNLNYTDVVSSQYYIYDYNTINNNYTYQFINKPLNSDFYLDFNNFSTNGVETRYFNSSSIQDPNKSSYLTLYGYLNATDLENNIKHRIWANGNQNSTIMNSSGYSYAFNTNFYNYSYIATMENYHVEAIGEPLENYNAPNWSIDYTYSNTNRTFYLNKTGTTHNIGKITMDLVDNDSFYTWDVLFDSQETSEITLPQLPDELKSWNITNYYNTGDLNIEQIEVKKYNGIDTYDSFLNTVIKNNIYQQYEATNKVESVFKTNTGTYISKPDFSFTY